MQLFYNKHITTSSTEISFTKEESRHIIKVLRKSNGDVLSITDGKGKLFSAEIIQDLEKKCVAKIIGFEEKEKAWDYHLHIAIAPTKLNDRYEWFLEKATEIGIDEITPIYCDHSERRNIKIERMEKVILSAMKQSLKFNLPKLNPPQKFKNFIANKDWDLALIAHCQKDNKNNLDSFFPFHKRLLILIGPEGDFSNYEIDKAISMGVHPITLGKSRLRTETAGIVACNYTSILNEIL